MLSSDLGQFLRFFPVSPECECICICCLSFTFCLNKCAATAEDSFKIMEDDLDMVSDLESVNN